jgi:hypothetical protein
MNADALVNDFAIRCFRDSADRDYIAARMSYRAALIPQFYWSSLQSIEKYLKAILLLNRVKANNVGHDLTLAFEFIERLPFEIRMSPIGKDFIKTLNAFGRFRYLEISYSIHGPMLVKLDRTVWEIRRYCRVINRAVNLEDGRTRSMLELEVARIADSEKQPPQKFRLAGGLLEQILDTKSHPGRSALIWQNAFFSSYTRKKVRMPIHFQGENAPLSLHPEILDEVTKYVFVPRDVIGAYRAELTKRSSGRTRV